MNTQNRIDGENAAWIFAIILTLILVASVFSSCKSQAGIMQNPPLNMDDMQMYDGRTGGPDLIIRYR